jgi:hypothetical protein
MQTLQTRRYYLGLDSGLVRRRGGTSALSKRAVKQGNAAVLPIYFSWVTEKLSNETEPKIGHGEVGQFSL